jgi:RNA polymerase sigma factor (sigma-70 family)
MPDTAPTRVEWIRAAMDGYQGRLIRFAARITGDVESARDVVQDTFLRLCRTDVEFVGDHLAAWLFRVCRNRALDVRKKERPLRSLEGAEAPTEGPDLDPHERLERTEEVRRVLAAVEGLTPAQQEILRLRFQEELSYKEIALVTAQSVSNVGFLIHTAMKQLRQELKAKERPLRRMGERIDA